jgi:TolA-binding protein
MRLKYSALFIVAVFLSACSDDQDKQRANSNSADSVATKPKESSEANDIENISRLEDRLKQDQTANYALGTMASSMYLDFARKHPQHPNTPVYLFKAAQVQNSIGKSQEAIATLQTIMEKYPKFENLPFCYFLQGFIYEDKLKDMAKAKERYEAVIKLYPGTDAAKNANQSLQQLGMTDAELLKMIKKNNK